MRKTDTPRSNYRPRQAFEICVATGGDGLVLALDCCGDVVVYGRFFQHLSVDGQSGAELFSGIGRDFGHEYGHAAGVAGDFIPAFEKYALYQQSGNLVPR